MDLAKMDIIYIVKPGDNNEELRYSIRSVAQNLPHRRIVIAGYTPNWLKDVYSIPVEPTGGKYEIVENNWRAAMADESVSEHFIVFNDDFFIMRPCYKIPVLNRGALFYVLVEYSKSPGEYYNNMLTTNYLLDSLGFIAPKSYALHVPMIMEKAKRIKAQQVIDASEYTPDQIQMRTFYGNYWKIGGYEISDVKTSSREGQPKNNDTFISSNDKSFYNGKMGEHIRQQFNKKCRYEV